MQMDVRWCVPDRILKYIIITEIMHLLNILHCIVLKDALSW